MFHPKDPERIEKVKAEAYLDNWFTCSTHVLFVL